MFSTCQAINQGGQGVVKGVPSSHCVLNKCIFLCDCSWGNNSFKFIISSWLNFD